MIKDPSEETEEQVFKEATLELLKKIRDTTKQGWVNSIVKWTTAYKLLKDTKDK